MKPGIGHTRPHALPLCIGMMLLLLQGALCTAGAQYKVIHLEKPVNTAGSETSALRAGDSVFVFASLQPDTKGHGAFGVKRPVTHLYQARLNKNGKLARPKHDRWGFCSERDHTGNLALDPLSRDAYFTRSDAETLHSEIWWARAKKRRGWEKPARLRGPVNDKQHTATHPAVGRLKDGTVVLYFVSDRPGGMGGMDIWQCTVADGMASEPVNLGPQVNSPHDEYTPYYDQANGTLYFSSDRPGGKGGFDVYCAVGARNTWQQAQPVCGCLNSEQNDLYFTVSRRDSASGFPAEGYLSSNRKDSYFLNDSMCCYDIYRWCIDTAMVLAQQRAHEEAERRAIEMARQAEAERKQAEFDRLFPLYLYFHNDDPDPHSTDTTTAADYSDCQLRYALLRSEYRRHQRSSHDSLLMERFFDSCVVAGFERAGLLLDRIAEAIAEGKTAVLTVAGYASPLYIDDYNHRLSQRRIVSFINMIRAWKGGTLAPALADGRLRVEQVPQGAVPPTDESRAADAIYSLPAASARRIEVRSCKIF